jgi:cell wall assembly regulator SMI1
MAGGDLIRRDGGPAQHGAVEAAEAALGVSLPDDYSAFLTEHDGGEPARAAFRFEQNNRDEEDMVQEFLGVAPVEAPRMNLPDTAGILGDGVPSGVLPIAPDPLGNYICIDARDGRDGPVLFWDHEEGFDPPDESNLHEIAPDLQTFLESLTEHTPLPTPRPRGLRRLFGR